MSWSPKHLTGERELFKQVNCLLPPRLIVNRPVIWGRGYSLAYYRTETIENQSP